MIRRDAVAATLCGAVGAWIIAACGGSAAPPDANVGVCGGDVGNASARTANYVVVLVTGPPEAMSASPPAASSTAMSPSPSSSPAESPAGEAVLNGALASVSGPGATHLELHICNRSTGAVMTSLHPAVSLHDTTTGAPAVAMPVAIMEGSGQGVNDLHYGNNVLLTAGDAYTITVRIDSANTVTLPYTVPTSPRPASASPAPNCLTDHQMC